MTSCNKVIPEHSNDIGDWCPHSGMVVNLDTYTDTRCPQGCGDSDSDDAAGEWDDEE